MADQAERQFQDVRRGRLTDGSQPLSLVPQERGLFLGAGQRDAQLVVGRRAATRATGIDRSLQQAFDRALVHRTMKSSPSPTETSNPGPESRHNLRTSDGQKGAVAVRGSENMAAILWRCGFAYTEAGNKRRDFNHTDHARSMK